MKFEDALKAMREGKKVKLPHWNEPIKIVTSIVFADGTERPFISTGCIISEDWEIVE